MDKDNTTEVKQKIRQIVINNLPQGLNDETPDDADLFSLGFDSLYAVPLVLELEEAFEFEFEGDDISFENFRTIDEIFRLVTVKLGL
jgi:acyl carrier protein